MLKTKHAQTRAQTRRIPDLVVEMLQRFGATRYQSSARILYFDKRGWQRADSYTGGLLKRTHWDNVYAVVGSDEVLITVGYREKRIKGK